MVKIKRIYEKADPDDGFRVLVDRLWPRGVSKEEAKLDVWYKDIAPSDELRKWFNHDTAKWDDFQKKYSEELGNNPKFPEFKDLVKKQKNVTLLFGAHDTEHNQAVVLQTFFR